MPETLTLPNEGASSAERSETKRQAASQGQRKSDKWKPRWAARRSKDERHQGFAATARRIGFSNSKCGWDQKQKWTESQTVHTKGGGKPLHKPGLFCLVFGVVLPVTAVIAETQTHTVASLFFDPFPSVFHVWLFMLIPLSNFLAWLAFRFNLRNLYGIMALSNGMAVGIAILYTLMLLPITPMFAFLIVAFVGILGLAPLLSIPASLLSGKTICQLAEREETFFDAHQLKHLGHLIVLIMVVCVELPSTLTRINLQLADSNDVQLQKQGLDFLRQWGSREVLLRACYERSGRATDILGSLAENMHPVSVDKARLIYYRVTGVAFNSVPIPASFRGTIQHAGLISDPAGLNANIKDEFDLDPDIAGEVVSGVARGLSLSESSITGAINADDTAGIDWDFSFENVSDIAREARAKILLPPGAVVTRATLWLNDLERETKIMPRGMARQTYQQAVFNHKQDPLLISMEGKDIVLVQCYPVARGTKTKIRLHISTPLQVVDKEDVLVMPTFQERNFSISQPFKLTFTSPNPLSIPGIESSARQSFKADIDNALLARFAAILHMPRAGLQSNAFSGEGEKRRTVVAPSDTVSKTASPSLAMSSKSSQSAFVNRRRLCLVIDQSTPMSAYRHEIIDALKSAPENLPLTVISVRNGDRILCIGARKEESDYKNMLAGLERSDCRGGQCDGNALSNALSTGDSDVLWIHAAQPYSNGFSMHNLLINAGASSPRLFDLQVISGPNELLANSNQYANLYRVTRSATLKDDILNFFKVWLSGSSTDSDGEKLQKNDTQTSKERKELAAYRKCLKLFQHGDRSGAYRLAQQFHLVTPVSSAVVDDEVFEKIKPIAEFERSDQSRAKDAFISRFREMKREVAKKKAIVESIYNSNRPYGQSNEAADSLLEAKQSRAGANTMPTSQSLRLSAPMATPSRSSADSPYAPSPEAGAPDGGGPLQYPVLQGIPDGRIGPELLETATRHKEQDLAYKGAWSNTSGYGTTMIIGESTPPTSRFNASKLFLPFLLFCTGVGLLVAYTASVRRQTKISDPAQPFN